MIWGAAVLFLCLSGVVAPGQRKEAPRPAPHFSAPRSAPARPQGRQQRPPQGRFQGNQFQQNQGQRPESGYHPAVPGQYPNANFNGAYTRPAYPGAAGRGANGYPGYAPQGHLQSWLNQHQGLPMQDQERLLRTDPNFNRLPPGQQQRLMQQLHHVDQMPEQSRSSIG